MKVIISWWSTPAPGPPVSQAPPRPPQAARGSWQGAGPGSPEEASRRACPFLSSAGPGHSNRRGESLRRRGAIGPHPGSVSAAAVVPRRVKGGGGPLPLPARPFPSRQGPEAHFLGGSSGALAGEDWCPDGGGEDETLAWRGPSGREWGDCVPSARFFLFFGVEPSELPPCSATELWFRSRGVWGLRLWGPQSFALGSETRHGSTGFWPLLARQKAPPRAFSIRYSCWCAPNTPRV